MQNDTKTLAHTLARTHTGSLQTLMVLVKKVPTKAGRRLLVIGTTSEPTFIQDSGLLKAFQIAYHTPVIKSPESLIKCLKHRALTKGDISDEDSEKVSECLYVCEHILYAYICVLLSLHNACLLISLCMYLHMNVYIYARMRKRKCMYVHRNVCTQYVCVCVHVRRVHIYNSEK